MTEQKNMPHIPLYLIGNCAPESVETAVERLLQNQYAPISLRELFLFRRGSKVLSPNACCVLVTAPAEHDMRSLLPTLQKAEIPIVAIFQERLSARLCNELLRMPHVTAIPLFTPQNAVYADAVYCETPTDSVLRDLRKNGVRMVITDADAENENSPFGMDILRVTPLPESGVLPCTENVQSCHGGMQLLPLDQQPIFSALPLAIPLGILGTEEGVLHHALACGEWQASYTPSEDRYDVHADFCALHTVSCAVSQDVCEMFCRYLSDGLYIELRLQKPVHLLGDADRLLLYGFDDTLGVFAARTALRHGQFDRIDVLAQTLQSICADHGVLVLLHTLETQKMQGDTASFVCRLQKQKEPCGGVYYGWEAAVRYANRFYTRFADGDEMLSADSLRNFLEERRRMGFALWYLAKSEDFYLEPFEDYLHMLAKICKPAIDDLRGKSMLKPDMPLYLTSELMRKLLYTEESCVSAFLEEWERSTYRKAYLDMLK